MASSKDNVVNLKSLIDLFSNSENLDCYLFDVKISNVVKIKITPFLQYNFGFTLLVMFVASEIVGTSAFIACLRSGN